MSIYPITVTRLPIFCLFGHSNGDGWVGSQELVDAHSCLVPATAFPLLYPAAAYYKNFYVYTSSHPWAGTMGTPMATDIGTGAWLELTTAAPDSPNGPHPHGGNYAYPNTAGIAYPHWFYIGYDSAALTGNNGGRCGVELPFHWHWLNHWQDQCGMVKVAAGSSLFLPANIGASASAWLNPGAWTPADPLFRPGTIDTVNQGYDFISWWTPADCFDFVPATKRFWQKWYDKMVGAAAALPAGTKMDVKLIIAWMGDNDSNARLITEMEDVFKRSIEEFVYKTRKACVDNDWTTLPLEQIPVVWMGVFSAYNNVNNSPIDTHDWCNDVIREVEAQDPYFRWIDTDGYNTMADDGEGSAIDTSNHLGSSGYWEAAKDIYEAFLEMQTNPFDAIAEEDRVLVSAVMDRVRTYYNRARTSTDPTDDTIMLHLNGALNSILNAIGDNAYWLRRRSDMELEVGTNNETTMPKYVARVLKIENPTKIEEGIQFQLLGHGDGGKCKIHLIERYGTTYTVHYITRPRDLTLTTEYVPLPRQIVEWLVVETVRRLARSGTNVALQASLEGEARDLRERCLKELQVQVRAKRDVMRTVRRWPRLSYKNARRPWASD